MEIVLPPEAGRHCVRTILGGFQISFEKQEKGWILRTLRMTGKEIASCLVMTY